MCSNKSVFTIAQAIMTPKKENTKGHEPIMLRIRSAARSPKERSAPDRTPGCRCQWVCQALVVMLVIVAQAGSPDGDRSGFPGTTGRSQYSGGVDRTGRAVLVYDGDCGFCSAAAWI